MDNTRVLTVGELYCIRDALQEQEEEDVREAMAIVEGALEYPSEKELDFND